MVREPPPSTWQATHLAIFACRLRSNQLLADGHDARHRPVDLLQFTSGQTHVDIDIDSRQDLGFVGEATGLVVVRRYQPFFERVSVDVGDAEHHCLVGHADDVRFREALLGRDTVLDREILEHRVLAVVAHQDSLGIGTEELSQFLDRILLGVHHGGGTDQVAEDLGVGLVEGRGDLLATLQVGDDCCICGGGAGTDKGERHCEYKRTGGIFHGYFSSR